MGGVKVMECGRVIGAVVGLEERQQGPLGRGVEEQQSDWRGAALTDFFWCCCSLDLARDLQKRVLFGSDRHWRQVPGPLMQRLRDGDEAD